MTASRYWQDNQWELWIGNNIGVLAHGDIHEMFALRLHVFKMFASTGAPVPEMKFRRMVIL